MDKENMCADPSVCNLCKSQSCSSVRLLLPNGLSMSDETDIGFQDRKPVSELHVDRRRDIPEDLSAVLAVCLPLFISAVCLFTWFVYVSNASRETGGGNVDRAFWVGPKDLASSRPPICRR